VSDVVKNRFKSSALTLNAQRAVSEKEESEFTTHFPVAMVEGLEIT